MNLQEWQLNLCDKGELEFYPISDTAPSLGQAKK